MQLIDGKATAAAIKAEIAEEVKEIVARGGKQPHQELDNEDEKEQKKII